MRFSDVVPIIEGKLYTWGLFRLQYPDAEISKYTPRIGTTETPNTTSPQERWFLRNERDLLDAKVIEDTLAKMGQRHRTLVWMRYVEREKWAHIARAIDVSEQQIYRERDQVLAVFAYAFGLLEENGLAS